jgi:hypothetical protein
MSKVIREQMQAVEAERVLQKSKRKEYSDAAVNNVIYLTIQSDCFFVLSFSGYNFVPKKMKKFLNIKKNYANRKNKNVYLIPF